MKKTFKEGNDTHIIEKTKQSLMDHRGLGQTVLMEKIIQNKSLDDLGEVEKAKKHRSANRPLNKLKNLNKNVNFCFCCNLPCEEKGLVEPYHYCDNVDKFSNCGLGVTFYFYFIRFSIVVLFIAICVIAISMTIFNKHYTKGINRVCNNIYKKNKENNISLCSGYITETEENINSNSGFVNDWILRFSSDNIKIYYLLHQRITNTKNAEDVIINYSILNFLLLITLFAINICYLILINAKTKIITHELTIKDYSILISNTKYVVIDFLNQVSNQQNKKLTMSKICDSENVEFHKYMSEYIKSDKSLEDIKINKINLCYNLGKYIEDKDKHEECKNQIFKIENDKHVKEINNKKGNYHEKRRYYNMCFSEYGIYCIRCEGRDIETIKNRKKELEEKLKLEEKNLKDISEANLTEYMFVSFENIEDREKILKEYPNHFFGKALKFFKNIKFYLCCCCLNEGEKIKYKKKMGLDVEDPPEPEDLYWENFQYSRRERLCKLFVSFFVCLMIMSIDFCIILGFTVLQNKIMDEQKSINLFVKYLLSLLITLITTGLNEALEYFLELFTTREHHISKTNFYLSFSIKIAVFTFLNSAVVPLLAKELVVKKRMKDIGYNLNRNNLLVDDMFVMFLVNAILTPAFWGYSFPYWRQRYKIYRIERHKVPDDHHYMTQRELNKLYECQDMRISYKYAYLAKTASMTFFYLPIFPIGFFISFGGFILGYLLELYNFTHLYKRPEMLNEIIFKSYTENFVIILFIGGIGDLFFFYEIFPNRAMSFVNFFLFLILIFIPLAKFFVCDFIGEKKRSEVPLSKKHFEFHIDYERENPITKNSGLIKYLKELKKEDLLSSNMLEMAIENINNANIMEIYYGIAKGNIPRNHQSKMANSNFKSILEKNVSRKNSLATSNIKNSIQNKNQPKLFDNLIKTIFESRISENNYIEHPINFPMDTIMEEDNIENKKDRLIESYNNPFMMDNMGLGALPFDEKIIKNLPLTKSQHIDNISQLNNQDDLNYKNTNSNDISITINKDIDNYRKNKLKEKIKQEKNSSPNDIKDNKQLDIIESSLNKSKKESSEIGLNDSKNNHDVESNDYNMNIPFKASIKQSQSLSEKYINSKIDTDFNKINNNDENNIINENNNINNYEDSISGNNNLNDIPNISGETNEIKNKDLLMNKSNDQNDDNIIPMDSTSNNDNKDQINLIDINSNHQLFQPYEVNDSKIPKDTEEENKTNSNNDHIYMNTTDNLNEDFEDNNDINNNYIGENSENST